MGVVYLFILIFLIVGFFVVFCLLLFWGISLGGGWGGRGGVCFTIFLIFILVSKCTVADSVLFNQQICSSNND